MKLSYTSFGKPDPCQHPNCDAFQYATSQPGIHERSQTAEQNHIHIAIELLSDIEIHWVSDRLNIHFETHNNPFVLPLFCLLLWYLLRSLFLICRWTYRKIVGYLNGLRIGKDDKQVAPSWPLIDALPNFDWQKNEPLKLRPFKPVYHLSMSLSRSDPSTLIELDNLYLSRINFRRQMLRDHPHETLAANTSAIPAVEELYNWLSATYLPTRFPVIFKRGNTSIYCTVTGESFPAAFNLLSVTSADPNACALAALQTLSSFVDTEFLILLPSDTATDGRKDGETYTLQAYTVCTPSGFSTRAKLNLPLAAIHGPVPGYAAKLEKSMDRYFARLEAGKWVERANWTVQTHSNLYCPPDENGKGNHWRPGDGVPQPEEHGNGAVNPENCHLRAERQVLLRMPGTGAVVFAFKTYLYPMGEVKAEGREVAESLADAIEGMRKGSVPEVWMYKRGFEWGEGVCAYLREGW